MTAEHLARLGLALVVVALPLGLAGAWVHAHTSQSATIVHARVSEDGGWLPGTLRARVEIPLQLQLVSDDVVHGFAIGRSGAPPVDLPPGQLVETTLTFSEPGIYTFYCTRWCGPAHWRMRGVIEVAGAQGQTASDPEPLYLSLGIDIDAPHPAAAVPALRPSASRAEALGVDLPEGNRSRQDFIRRSPAETWQSLRSDPSSAPLSDAQVWDLVARLWRSTTTAEALAEGRALYAQNCAACHGEAGAGDGVMASSVPPAGEALSVGAHLSGPANFTESSTLLGASSALLQGKILRGGMGTGMPYWGPILTEAQIWALTDYLWTFQFEE